MRIGVSALAMRGCVAALDSGIARYCAGLVEAWIEEDGGHEFVVWVSPDFEVPGEWRRNPRVTFEVASGIWSRYKTRAMRWALRRADGLVAISEHTKAELARLFGVATDRVTVTPLGFAGAVRASAPRDFKEQGLRDLGVRGEDYLLTLSTVEPRKNLPRLFEAFAELISAGDRGELRLVVVGSRGWKTAPIYRRPRELGIADRVDFLGYVPDSDLPDLFAHCQAFVLPSIIEGFGLPLLEAMAFGAPVVCSDSGSLREVGGDVPIYFDPLSVEDMTTAIRSRLDSAEPREEISMMGRQRAAGFSWRDTAERTLAALVAAASPSAGGAA
jgi:alpha-1,3-rhamnosyl/mannosyltransferase